MRFIDLFQMSISSLMKRKVRTLLTVLGVVIGTTSIVVMVSLGIGLKSSMMDQLSSYQSLTEVAVSLRMNYDDSSKNKDVLYLDDDTINTFMGIEHVVGVSPELRYNVILKMGKYAYNTDLVGLEKESLESKKWEFASGGLPEGDKEIMLVYGNSVPTGFYIEKSGVYPFWDGAGAPNVDLQNDKVYIIYDTDAYYKAQSNSSGSGANQTSTGTTAKKPKMYLTPAAGVMAGELEDWGMDSDEIFCDMDALKAQLKRVFKGKAIPGQPLNKAKKPFKDKIFYSNLSVEVDQMENVEEVTQIINDMGYSASNSAEWIQSQMDQMNMIQAVLGAIGAVALLVAAIGITNTMMMSIYERTKEIGVMKVLGCDMKNIQQMFLMEAGFIGFLGGIVGLILSWCISLVINDLTKNSDIGLSQISRIPLWLPIPVILFAVTIGMISGFLPSLRAMKLSPLAAIRSE